MSNDLIPVEIIEHKIYFIRNQKVMLDSDLANLYDIETRILNRDVQRNMERFPNDFMFQLTDYEWESLKSQIGISKEGRGGRRFNPYVFTEYGVLMLSNVLGSKKAITVSIQIIRVFTKLKEMAVTNKELAQRLDDLEYTVMLNAKEARTDIDDILRQLRRLTEFTKSPQTKAIGFKVENKEL
ncbi:MAG: ORF6N domain-containing protein [Candidatus Gastranaerophilaceae bacterium]|jgi:hypothetical protein